MKTLTDGIIDLRAKVKTLEAQHFALTANKADVERVLRKCQDTLMTQPPPPDPVLIVSGYALGLVSVGMLTAGILMDMPSDVRSSVVGIGVLGALAGGVMLLP